MHKRSRLAAVVGGALLLAASACTGGPSPTPTPTVAPDAPWLATSQQLEQRVDELLAQMTPEEKATLLEQATAPADDHAVGYVAGVPRLGIPAMSLSDGPAGVGDKQPATAMPAPVSLAATFDRDAAHSFGSVLGKEAKARGYQVLYAPMVNIVRIPQGGRDYEMLGEDPYLTGELAAAEIGGIQDQKVAAQVKHVAGNDQENDRETSSSTIDERTLHEIYLAPFEDALHNGHAWSAMCAYNQVNGTWSCENAPLLHDVLRDQWGWDGVIGSDYPATHSTAGSLQAGEDQEFDFDTEYYFTPEKIAAAVQSGKLAASVVDDAARRVLRLLFRAGAFDGAPPPAADPAAGAAQARTLAARGTVLLKNDPQNGGAENGGAGNGGALLPLTPEKSIAVIGGRADQASTGGGGSSAVTPYPDQTVDPVQGLRNAGVATVTFTSGAAIPDAVTAARAADVAVVVADDVETEGSDRPSIALPGNQDALISAVSAANPATVVVLRTGGPVTMPWLDSVRAVLEAWYPGEQDGNALADVLLGQVDPAGRLPITFPTSSSATPMQSRAQYPGATKGGFTTYDYSERLNVGYRWYDAQGTAPLFPFGFGLSYTSFDYKDLTVAAPDAAGNVQVGFTVTNTGTKAGDEVPQVYVGYPAEAGEPPHQLRGFSRVSLAPGASQQVAVTLDRAAFQQWDPAAHQFRVAGGQYPVLVGRSSRDLPLTGTATVQAATIANGATGPVTQGSRCLALAQASAVQTADCTGSGQQTWHHAPDGSMQVLGACLDSTGDSPALRTCTGIPAQLWDVKGDTLTSSGRCLDSAGGPTVRMAACTSTPTQAWTGPGSPSP
jgi:beta-glucosidase